MPLQGDIQRTTSYGRYLKFMLFYPLPRVMLRWLLGQKGPNDINRRIPLKESQVKSCLMASFQHKSLVE